MVPRRILITGAGGFIGGALARRLTSNGHVVRGLDLPEVIARSTLADRRGHDLTRAVPPAALAGVELVIHGAALAGVQPSWKRPAAYWAANAHATERLRTACERAGTPRVIHLSSISVYGEGVGLDERSGTHPQSPYGHSKLAGEHAWDGYADVTTVRLSNVYGPGQRSDMAYATFMRAAVAGRPIALRDGGRQLRTPTYIDDCIAGILAAMSSGAPGAVYNIAGPEDVRLAHVPRAIGQLLGHPVACTTVPPAPGDPRIATVSCTRARTELGYAPRTSLRAGLEAQWAAAHKRERAPARRAATS